MYCDYNELANYNIKLNQLFNEINDTMDALEASYKTIYNNANWNSETSNYFNNQTKQVFANMESINTKCFNIKNYIDIIVENYREADSSLDKFFDFKG